jgi:hypothetical protein
VGSSDLPPIRRVRGEGFRRQGIGRRTAERRTGKNDHDAAGLGLFRFVATEQGADEREAVAGHETERQEGDDGAPAATMRQLYPEVSLVLSSCPTSD